MEAVGGLAGGIGLDNRHTFVLVSALVDETVLVGDSPIDLETARRAGTRICLARYGFGFRFGPGAFRGDEWFIDAPDELPGMLEREPTQSR